MDTIDLRLLTNFDEIFKTRSVTRAAIDLGLGPPTESVALAKLRTHFGDPLFVRTSGDMEPSSVGADLVVRRSGRRSPRWRRRWATGRYSHRQPAIATSDSR